MFAVAIALACRAGEQEGLCLAATAVGGVCGKADGRHHVLGVLGAGHFHIPGKSEHPGFCFLLIPR